MLVEGKLTSSVFAKALFAALFVAVVWTPVVVAANAPVEATVPPPIIAPAAKTPFSKVVDFESRFASDSSNCTLGGAGCVAIFSKPTRVNKHCTHCFPDLYNFTRVVRELSVIVSFFVRFKIPRPFISLCTLLVSCLALNIYQLINTFCDVRPNFKYFR